MTDVHKCLMTDVDSKIIFIFYHPESVRNRVDDFSIDIKNEKNASTL